MAGEIKTVGVIGAGEPGRESAFAALVAGYLVILEDVSEERLAQAVDWIAREDADLRLRLILACTVEEAVREADLIFEAVADEVEMKIEMFTIFDKFAKPDAIFASSASSISIAELAAVTFCPERCIGMRLAAATGHMGLLEVVPSQETAEETLARCEAIARRMGRQIVINRDIGNGASPRKAKRAQRKVAVVPEL